MRRRMNSGGKRKREEEKERERDTASDRSTRMTLDIYYYRFYNESFLLPTARVWSTLCAIIVDLSLYSR